MVDGTETARVFTMDNAKSEGDDNKKMSERRGREEQETKHQEHMRERGKKREESKEKSKGRRENEEGRG